MVYWTIDVPSLHWFLELLKNKSFANKGTYSIWGQGIGKWELRHIYKTCWLQVLELLHCTQLQNSAQKINLCKYCSHYQNCGVLWVSFACCCLCEEFSVLKVQGMNILRLCCSPTSFLVSYETVSCIYLSFTFLLLPPPFSSFRNRWAWLAVKPCIDVELLCTCCRLLLSASISGLISQIHVCRA